MSKIQIIPPETETATYVENNIINFTLTYDGFALKKNSIRICGEVQVLNNNQALLPADKVYYDSVLGAHGLFRQITSEINSQTIETIENYPMTAKSMFSCGNNQLDFMSSVEKNMCLQIGNDALSGALISKTNAIDGDVATQNTLVWNSFVCKPFISLNRSDIDISSKKGNASVSFYINQKSNFLYGDSAATIGNCSVTLRNVYLIYETVDDTAQNQITTMNKIFLINQVLNSNNQQYSMNAPIVAKASSIVFHEKDTPVTRNAYDLEVLPNVTSVSFSVNNVDNYNIKYSLQNPQDILINYLNSWGYSSKDKNLMSLDTYNTYGNNYGMGINFGDQVSFTNKAFGLNIQSGVVSTRPYDALIIFHAIIQV